MGSSKFSVFIQFAIAFAVFFAVALLFFYPEYNGKALFQSDISQWNAMRQELKAAYDKTGEVPFWTNSMFGGMPSVLIWQTNDGNPIGTFMSFLLGIFTPSIYKFMLIVICFYFLSGFFTKNIYIKIFGSLAIALGTFTIASIEAGHSSKVVAFAYFPLLILGFLYSIKQRYILGFVVTMLGAYFSISANHVQITYYGALAMVIVGLFSLYLAFKEKNVTSFIKGVFVFAMAMVIGLTANIKHLKLVKDFQKQTIRNGSVLAKKSDTKTGLDREYAFGWSYGKYESLSILVPGILGYSSNEKLSNTSATYKALEERTGTEQADSFTRGAPMYFGDLPFTGGPIYFGVVVMFLAVLAFFISNSRYKWAFGSAFLLCLLLGMGKNLSSFNYLLFDTLPYMNKFRTVMMANMIGNIFIVLLAILSLVAIVENSDRASLLDGLKKSTFIVGGLCLLVLFSMFFIDFSSNSDAQFKEYDWLLSALKKDRSSMLLSSALRSLMFVLLTAGFIFLYIKEKIKGANVLLIGLMLLSFVDLTQMAKRYLTADKFMDKEEIEGQYVASPIDNQILQDKDLYYRVHDVTTDPFNNASRSYFHKTVGGYNPAKLSIYQDLIENQIAKGNQKVFDMLNTRYFIVSDEKTKQQKVIANPNALGNAWAVQNIVTTSSPKAEMEALTNFNPRKDVVIPDADKSKLQAGTEFDSTGTVKLLSYYPDKTEYESSFQTAQNVVFSEIYYPENMGLTCTIDDKPVHYAKANYVLRAVKIPAGKHRVVWSYKPLNYDTLHRISTIAQWFILLITIAASAFGLWKILQNNTEVRTA